MPHIWILWRNLAESMMWRYGRIGLMPNHVHLVAVPSEPEGLRLAIGEAHRCYTRRINFREGWRGHLWQARFSSFVMDERYLLACIRYIENNPVRAKRVNDPGQWIWSSAAAHISGENDRLVNIDPLPGFISSDWREFLGKAIPAEEMDSIRRHERTGRPLGNTSFIGQLEGRLGRCLRPVKPGRKPKQDGN